MPDFDVQQIRRKAADAIALSVLPSYGEPTQIVQPWMFGHPESKATCLWLRGVPPLVMTSDARAEMASLPKSQAQRVHYMSPGPDRWRDRSRALPGMAEAMASQWGRQEQAA